MGQPAYEIARLFPDQGQWSDGDYLDFTQSLNRLVELSDGAPEVLPMPTREHQLVLARLSDRFRTLAKEIGGICLFAPMRLRLRPGKFREPDLIFLRRSDDPRNQNEFWTGTDIAVEILGPHNPERDTVTKRQD